jgi:hypothetical protein
MIKYIFTGFSAGITLDVLWWIFGKQIQDTWILKFLCWISTPVAIVFSKISGWPLEQESAIAVYIFAILITLPLLGIIIALLFRLIKNHLQFSNAK